MRGSKKLLALALLCSALTPCAAAWAQNVTITNNPAWNGATIAAVYGWGGVTNNDNASLAFGQTFTAPGIATPGYTSVYLNYFQMHLSQYEVYQTLPAQQYYAYVAPWNAGTAGTPIFTSSLLTAPASTFPTFTPVNIDTNRLPLTPGQQYIAYLSPFGNGLTTTNNYYYFGSTTQYTSTIDGGGLVYQFDGDGSSWVEDGIYGAPNDLAFVAAISN